MFKFIRSGSWVSIGDYTGTIQPFCSSKQVNGITLRTNLTSEILGTTDLYSLISKKCWKAAEGEL